MTTFFSVTSHIGDAKIANAVALNQQVGITHLAVGDGNGHSTTPTKDKTTLANETYRAQVSSLVVDDANPNYFIATLVIPPEIGGFTIREAAVFTSDGALFAISNFPETYKPNLPEGGIGELTVQFYFAVVSPQAVKIVVDPYVTIATRQWCLSNLVSKADFNQLKNNLDENEPIIVLPDGNFSVPEGRKFIEIVCLGSAVITFPNMPHPKAKYVVKSTHKSAAITGILGEGHQITDSDGELQSSFRIEGLYQLDAHWLGAGLYRGF